MNSDDIEVLNYRTDVAIYYMIFLFVSLFCYGVSCIVNGLALANLWKRLRSSLAVKMLFVLVLVELLFATVANLSLIIGYVKQFLIYHLYSTTIPISQQVGSDRAVKIAFNIKAFAQLTMIPIANLVLIWRAWILYPSNLWVRMGLVISWICDFGACMAKLAFNFVPGYLESSTIRVIGNRLNGADAFLTLGVNLVTTLAIAWKAWRHNLFLRVNEMRKTSAVLPVLYTMIEWGVLLCLAQLINGVMTEITIEGDPASTQFIAASIINLLNSFTVNIHPALTVLILAKGRSVIENDTMTVSNLRHHGPATPPSMVGPVSTMKFAQSIGPIANSEPGNSDEDPETFVRFEKRDAPPGLDIPSPV